MENASKALIIAGSILIALLLFSIGIMLFNGSSGLFSNAKTKMSEQERSMFNQEYTMYEGNRNTGNQIKELIRKVIVNNSNSGDNGENPEIKINNKPVNSGTNINVLPGKNTTILNAKQYTVTCVITKGIVNNILITEN